MRRTLVIMVKEPQPGRVKTRLGRDIGMVSAAWWFRHQSLSLIRRMQSRRWDTVLAVSSDREGMMSRVWPERGICDRIGQGSGDLGQRMRRVFETVGSGPVCIIGADVPGIMQTHIARAFAALGDHDAVFGPADDGGYWLVGLKHPTPLPPGLFRDVRWSTADALTDSVAPIPSHRVAFVDRLGDVDTLADLNRLKA